jgi:ribonuclease J
MSEPFSEEDIEDEAMHNWMDHFQIQFHQLHASGHMNKQQLIDLIKKINPNRVFPIHTENQHLFKKTGNNIQKIQYGKEYVVQ